MFERVQELSSEFCEHSLKGTFFEYKQNFSIILTLHGSRIA